MTAQNESEPLTLKPLQSIMSASGAAASATPQAAAAVGAPCHRMHLSCWFNNKKLINTAEIEARNYIQVFQAVCNALGVCASVLGRCTAAGPTLCKAEAQAVH